MYLYPPPCVAGALNVVGLSSTILIPEGWGSGDRLDGFVTVDLSVVNSGSLLSVSSKGCGLEYSNIRYFMA